MRARVSLLAILIIVGCNRRDDAPLRLPDGSLLSSSGGEVQLSDGSRLQFVITSERYKQWDAARNALRPNVVSRFGVLLQPKSPTEQSIDRAVSFLETDVPSREAIQRAGMTVKDFVLMTVALEQQMQAASARDIPRSQPVSTPAPAIDSGYVAPPSPTPTVQPTPRVDTIVKPDTIFTAPRRDTPAPRRDTSVAKRDTVVPRSTRDTVRDTMSTTPRVPRGL